MKSLKYQNYNHLIYLYYKPEDKIVKPYLEKLSQQCSNDTIFVNLFDFIKSQLDYKIVTTEYRYLIAGSVYIIKSDQFGEEYEPKEDIIDGLKTLINDFVKIFSIAGIYIYNKYGIFIELGMPEKLNNYFDFTNLNFKDDSTMNISEEDVFKIMDEFECLEDFKNDVDLADSYLIWLCSIYKNFKV